MMFISDIINYIMDKKLYIQLEDKIFPMDLNYYIADGIFFFKVNRENTAVHTIDDLITDLEYEARDESWANDIYCSPMEQIENCEIRFPKDFDQVLNDDIFDNCYKITKEEPIKDTLIICLE